MSVSAVSGAISGHESGARTIDAAQLCSIIDKATRQTRRKGKLSQVDEQVGESDSMEKVIQVSQTLDERGNCLRAEFGVGDTKPVAY